MHFWRIFCLYLLKPLARIVLLVTLCFQVLFFHGCKQPSAELQLIEDMLNSKPYEALRRLQRIEPSEYQKIPSDKALFGLLYFKALDATLCQPGPDSLIDSSIAYYEEHNDHSHLSHCYFLKARKYKNDRKFESAAGFYLKAVASAESSGNSRLLGSIYADMANIYFIQHNYPESAKKLNLSLDCLYQADDSLAARFCLIEIGRIHRLLQDYTKAQYYCREAIKGSSDSLLLGLAFQETGISCYCQKKFDSAKFYLTKSLDFPFKGVSYSERCFFLSALYSDTGCADSASYYAQKALCYPADFSISRECYKTLANIEYQKGNLKQMAKFISRFQDFSDSLRLIENLPKMAVVEGVHQSSHVAESARQKTVLIATLLMVVLLSGGGLSYKLYRRSRIRKIQLEGFRQKLVEKQNFVSHTIVQRLDEMRQMQSANRKAATPEERQQLDKELYEKCFHLNDWGAFCREMNQAFNHIIDRLTEKYPSISRKEITWCCLHLLDVPLADRTVVLDATADSLYKLKQRLAKKLGLGSAKEMDIFLKKEAGL